jgi:AbrB family looped-hinge helix DNA binding protein
MTRTIAPPSSQVILGGMTYRVGPKGQVVIPKTIREELGIEPGDEVDVERRRTEVVIRRHRVSAAERRERITGLRGLLADLPGGGTEDLEAIRRDERLLEERRDRGRRGDRP